MIVCGPRLERNRQVACFIMIIKTKRFPRFPAFQENFANIDELWNLTPVLLDYCVDYRNLVSLDQRSSNIFLPKR